MTNRFSKTIRPSQYLLRRRIWLVLVVAFIVAGCGQGHKEDTSVYELLTDPNFVMPEYASRAIEATGGLEAWTKTKELELDCVVTLYKSDGSFYLTEQHHEIYPPSNSVRISALEPQGKFAWQLSGGIFTVLEGAKQIDALPIAIENRDFAKAILDITTAPVRFLDKSFAFTKGTKPVKIEGQWYYPIEQVVPNRIRIEPYWCKVVFYQNTDTSRIDMLWFVAADEKNFLAVRGYDYKEVEKGSILVPNRIEIFGTDAESPAPGRADGALRERLVRIDYYRLKSH